jgi:hypothetical protein
LIHDADQPSNGGVRDCVENELCTTSILATFTTGAMWLGVNLAVSHDILYEGLPATSTLSASRECAGSFVCPAAHGLSLKTWTVAGPRLAIDIERAE